MFIKQGGKPSSTLKDFELLYWCMLILSGGRIHVKNPTFWTRFKSEAETTTTASQVFICINKLGH